MGRIQARHPQVHDLYQTEIRDVEASSACTGSAALILSSGEAREGAYLLRTNLSGH